MNYETFSLIALGLIKFIGYSFFALYLNKYYSRPFHPVLVGFIRSLIGVFVGLVYMAIWENVLGGMSRMSTSSMVGYYGGLLPLRFAEWWVVINFIYRPDEIKMDKEFNIWLATGVSFVLDIPGIFALLVARAAC